jgi:hypothetical protein
VFAKFEVKDYAEIDMGRSPAACFTRPAGTVERQTAEFGGPLFPRPKAAKSVQIALVCCREWTVPYLLEQRSSGRKRSGQGNR